MNVLYDEELMVKDLTKCEGFSLTGSEQSVQQWVTVVPKTSDVSLKELFAHYAAKVCEAARINEDNAEYIFYLLKDLWVRALYPRIYEASAEPQRVHLKVPPTASFTFCPPLLHVTALSQCRI